MDHDRNLANAFDGQAAKFERAPVQTDPAALGRLIDDCDFPAKAHILDAGCGPGLVCKGLLDAGFTVTGADLSKEMIERARMRCKTYGKAAEFIQSSIFDDAISARGPFDGAVSRYVLHHVIDPHAFLKRQVELLKKDGVLVASDHVTDPVLAKATFHREIEIARDKTHTSNLTTGELADIFAAIGLTDISAREESFQLDFDEWFDRGTPSGQKTEVRNRILSGQGGRGFSAAEQSDGTIKISCVRATVRGIKP